MISLQNVSKTFITTYGDVKALKNINMSVKKGEIFVAPHKTSIIYIMF